MTESQFRLAPPQQAAYETSPGEQAVLRGLEPKNLGMMYGMLLGQRGDANERMAQYAQQLNRSNAEQAILSRAQLEEAGRQHDGTIAASLAERGLGLPEALQASRLGGLQVSQSPETSGRNILRAQDLRERATRASNIDKLGSGLFHLRQAGVNTNEGQPLASPDEAQGLKLTTGRPLALEIEGLQQAGANARHGSGDGPGSPLKITHKYDPISQMPTVEVKGGPAGYGELYISDYDKWARTDRLEGKPFVPPPIGSAAVPAPSASAATGSPLEGDLPGVSDATRRLLQGGGNMNTARGAQPPPASASPPGTPTRQVTPPSGGTAPPAVVARARSMPGIGTYKGVAYQNGKWYAVGSKDTLEIK
jgi:hypothetical protein